MGRKSRLDRSKLVAQGQVATPTHIQLPRDVYFELKAMMVGVATLELEGVLAANAAAARLQEAKLAQKAFWEKVAGTYQLNLLGEYEWNDAQHSLMPRP